MQQNVPLGILEQIHDGQTHIGEYLSLIFQNRDVFVWWKDINSIWQGANQLMADFWKISYPEDMIGLTDFDFAYRESDAEIYRLNDQNIIQSNEAKLKFDLIEPKHCKDGEIVLANVTKMPVYKNGQIIGTVGFESIVPSKNTDYCLVINHLKEIAPTFQKEKRYFIILDEKTESLTSKQASCLTYLSMGKTVKQIANLLDCSTYNIEDYIIRLKQKLGVYTTAALIDCFWNNPIRWF